MNSSERSSVCGQQKMEIRNRQNEKLVGLLHETGSREIVVLCHGFKSNKKSKIIKNLASCLEEEGMSAFRFDFSGNGESEGSFNYGNYNYEADDLHSVIQHFNSKNRVVNTILGHSRGGNVVLLYASKYHHISNVITISGRYDLKQGIRLGDGYLERIKLQGFIDDAKPGKPVFRVTEKSLMERLNTNMQEACLKINQKSQVLIVHGSKDKIVPVADAKEFAKIIPNRQLEILEGADHGFTRHESQLVSIVINFIKRVEQLV